MGLDSVELVVEIEKYFGIQIPDIEAEKIYTVQNMVDTVAQYLNVKSEDTLLRDKIFADISSCLQIVTKSNSNFLLTDKVAKYLAPRDKERWNEFENILKLKIPKPDSYNPHSTKLSDKFKKLISWTPNYDWQTVSFEQFVNVICANNYQTLLDQYNFKSKYEIYIGVMGITVEKIGIDYFEILPEKSFTNDLGID